MDGAAKNLILSFQVPILKLNLFLSLYVPFFITI